MRRKESKLFESLNIPNTSIFWLISDCFITNAPRNDTLLSRCEAHEVSRGNHIPPFSPKNVKDKIASTKIEMKLEWAEKKGSPFQ